MSKIQKEANRQDQERLNFESLYFPLFVGVFENISKYIESHFDQPFNNISNIDIYQFRFDFMSILDNMYPHVQGDSFDKLSEPFDNIVNFKNRVLNNNAISNSNHIQDQLFFIIDTTKKEIVNYYNDYDPTLDIIIGAYIADRILNNANNRSYLISQQNVGIAYESSKQNMLNVANMEQEDNYQKMWVTMGDNKVRHAHEEADRQVVDANSFFVVNNELLRYPKDMNYGASIGNTINCRCVSIPIKS